MIKQIKIPSPGESITEVEIASWMVEDGDIVEKDQDIAEIESDKATLSLVAEVSGKIKIIAQQGHTIEVGAVACEIDTSAAAEEQPSEQNTQTIEKTENKPETTSQIPPKTAPTPQGSPYDKVKISPVAQQLMNEHNLSVDDVINGLRRISKNDIQAIAQLPEQPQTNIVEQHNQPNSNGLRGHFTRDQTTEKMSSLRRKLSERLVAVKNETAMLTTFNEVDMSAIMKLRQQYQKKFVDKFGVKVGFMSFFLKSAAYALMKYPGVNAQLDGEQILYHDYADIGIAVQSKKGLMVPVIRNVESMTLAEIELKIKEYARKGQDNKISLDEMKGGTFTVTNGGTFGSLMSTPIINPPQSGILGMHNIVERPVAIDGNVEIRPMMYIALSYDHRIIDGKSAVGFLVKIKELVENPVNLLFGERNPINDLLDI